MCDFHHKRVVSKENGGFIQYEIHLKNNKFNWLQVTNMNGKDGQGFTTL